MKRRRVVAVVAAAADDVAAAAVTAAADPTSLHARSADPFVAGSAAARGIRNASGALASGGSR